MDSEWHLRGLPKPRHHPAKGNCGHNRGVVRGGSWGYFPVDPRSAYRYGDLTVDRNYNLGFRVARTLLQGVR